MNLRPIQSQTALLSLAFVISLCLHGLFLSLLSPLELRLDEDLKNFQKIEIIHEMPKVETMPPPEVKRPIPPKPDKISEPRKKHLEKPRPKPILGFSPDTVTKGGKGIDVPLGNTLLAPDEGTRLRAEDMANLESDLSKPAQLIRSSVSIPEYTREAVDADLEGLFVVDVFVDEKGNVIEADLSSKVGFGMDERLLKAARNANFEPRKNRLGIPIPGWTDITFKLEVH
ncbi:MAG: TonB family protein [Deltaproteobacteria bacterium]|nr:TonB family protein [Deltaproteobacteria bacterium]